MGMLGRLNVKLSAETADFYHGMDKASAKSQQSMQRIQRDIKRVGAVIGTVMVAAAGAFSVKMKQIIDDADNLSKTSQKIGVSVQSLSVYRHAAQLAGSSFESLTKGIGRFSRVISDASEGLMTAKRPLEFLNIEIQNADGSLRAVEPALLDVADKFSKMADGTKKAALAQELFGRAGVELIPFLNQGRAGIEEVRKEAERLGIVFDSKMAKSAEEFNDNMTRLKGAMDGVFVSIGNSLIPTLVDLSDQMVDNASKTKDFKNKGEGLATTLLTIIEYAQRIGWVFQETGILVGDSMAIIQRATGIGNKGWFLGGEEVETEKNRWGAIKAIWKKSGEDQKELLGGRTSAIEEMWEKHNDRLAGIVEEGVISQSVAYEEASDKIAAALDKQKDAAEEAESVMKDMGSTFSSAAEAAIMAGEKFSVFADGLIQDIARIALRKKILDPIFNSIFGDAGFFSGSTPAVDSGATMSMIGGGVGSAHGNVFSGGNLMRFASGGIIGGPMTFPMAGGRQGLAGEAGIEAILPLKRTSGGDLGVKAETGGGVQVNVYAPPGSNVTEERSMDGGIQRIDIMIDETVANNIGKPGSSTSKALRNNFGIGQKLINR